MTEEEIAQWYRAQSSTDQPALPEPAELRDCDWRLGWEFQPT